MTFLITIIHSRNITARLIQLGGFIECLLKGIKPEKIYNHDEIRWVDNEGVEQTFGSISEGTVTREWGKYWGSLNNAQKIDYKINLNEDQVKRAFYYIKNNEGRPYEYSMFIYHAKRIFTGKWFGKKDNSKLFCLENAVRWLNYVLDYDINPYISPLEFKQILDSKLNTKQ